VEETDRIAAQCVANVLTQTHTSPADVDAVITACTCFAPTPSIAASIVNRFKMRPDVLTFSLAGQGCGASVLCVDLAARLLATLPAGANVLIFNHENITHNWYSGNERSMLITNCLFRASGAAVLMTNARGRAGYELTHVERTMTASGERERERHGGERAGEKQGRGCAGVVSFLVGVSPPSPPPLFPRSDDAAYTVMGEAQDSAGLKGIFLTRRLVEVASTAIRANVTRLAPAVLPLRELARAARDRAYVPRFDKAFDHFLMHAGSRVVLKSVQAALGLSDAAMAPSVDTLARFGNASSASTWITLAHAEAHGRGVRKGERLWQLGLGGGFKCLSACWVAVRDNRVPHAAWGPTIGMTEEAAAAAAAGTA
jgi:3-ketoacyl-CoA synthase